MSKPKKQPPAFAERLTVLRETAGLTKNALAVKAGLDPSFIGELERGTKFPGWETVCKLADALGVGLDEFRGERKGEK